MGTVGRGVTVGSGEGAGVRLAHAARRRASRRVTMNVCRWRMAMFGGQKSEVRGQNHAGTNDRATARPFDCTTVRLHRIEGDGFHLAILHDDEAGLGHELPIVAEIVQGFADQDVRAFGDGLVVAVQFVDGP